MTNHHDIAAPETISSETKARFSTTFIGIISTIIAGLVIFLVTSAGARSDARNDVLTTTRIDVGKLQRDVDTLKSGQDRQREQIDTLDGKIDSMAVDLKELVSRPHEGRHRDKQ